MVSVIAALCIVSLALTPFVNAAVPNMIYYQGQLTDALGAPLDTMINMTFTIYDDSSGGTIWWTETQPGVIVSNGLFTVLLGSVGGVIVDTVFRDDFRWLGVQIASDPEITPRTRLVNVPWAYRVSTLDGATGGHVYGWIQLHSEFVVGDLMQEGAAGHLYVTNGEAPFFIVNGSSQQVGIGGTEVEAQFHVETPNRRYAATFASSYPSHTTHVTHSEYTGTSSFDAAGVYGSSVPVDNFGYGGIFQGGYRGAYGSVDPTGDHYYYGVMGDVDGGSGSNFGVFGLARGSGSNYGLYGSANDTSGTSNYGVFGYATDSLTKYGVYGSTGSSTEDYAGYFYGNIHTTGTSTKGGGGSKIDHPLDPANKYLYHSSVESPDMKNVYDGVVILDARGEATVELPDYFEAVNRDSRYQLTAIGVPGPKLYVAEEITDNHFKIAGGASGMKVSWQVTGIRKDSFAEANRIQAEVDKPFQELGTYLHPEAHGLGKEYGIHYEQHKRLEEELQDRKAREMGQR
jgi:hypothetical protein